MNTFYSYHLIIFIQKLRYSSYTPVEEIRQSDWRRELEKIYQ